MVAQKHVHVGNVTFGNDLPFCLIAGPCSMEGRNHALEMAHALSEMCSELGIGLIYKSSFDKANRTSVEGNRGIGIMPAMSIFQEVKDTYGCPVITDVHTEDQCAVVGEVCDMMQIPAFLCRQTDLLLAAGQTGKAVNVKKGQFLAPWDMGNVCKKVASTGNDNILITERGSSFGYNALVTDMRGLPQMAEETGYPIIIDCTHSVQQPGGQGNKSGGRRELAPVVARAAIALGIAGVFAETHNDPDKAISDGPNMIPVQKLKGVLQTLQALDEVAKANPVDLVGMATY